MNTTQISLWFIAPITSYDYGLKTIKDSVWGPKIVELGHRVNMAASPNIGSPLNALVDTTIKKKGSFEKGFSGEHHVSKAIMKHLHMDDFIQGPPMSCKIGHGLQTRL